MTRHKYPQFEFAVVAGDLKGRRITAPDLGATRPPLTRIRKAIFDFLDPYLLDAAYLDLFSGTGSYLFEAVSRGAALAMGVEQEQKLVESINRQAATLGVADRLRCLRDDVFRAVERFHADRRRWNIVMLAPPQHQGLIDRTLAVFRTRPIFEPDALILCQHETAETKRIDFRGFPIQQQRKYGNTTFTILGGTGS